MGREGWEREREREGGRGGDGGGWEFMRCERIGGDSV